MYILYREPFRKYCVLDTEIHKKFEEKNLSCIIAGVKPFIDPYCQPSLGYKLDGSEVEKLLIATPKRFHKLECWQVEIELQEGNYKIDKGYIKITKIITDESLNIFLKENPCFIKKEETGNFDGLFDFLD